MPRYTPDATLREMQWKAPRGPWYARKSYTIDEGGIVVRKFRSKSTKLRNKVEARKKVLEILAEWSGRGVEGSIEIFSQASSHYKNTKQNKSHKYLLQIANSKTHLDFYFGNKKLNSITAADWENYVASRREIHPSVALFNDWKTFSGIMKLMHIEGHRRRKLQVPNPDKDRDLPEVVYSDEQIARMIQVANPTNGLQIAMAADLFMRRWEILGLKTEQVSFKVEKDAKGRGIYGTITLYKSSTKIRKERKFPMTKTIYELLQRRMQYLNRRWERTYGMKPAYIFPTRGNPNKPTRTIRAFQRIKRDAGITEGTFHTIRHSALTRAFERAQSEAGMQGRNEIAPNSVKICIMAGLSLQMAMDRYLHIKPSGMADIIDMSWGVASQVRNIGDKKEEEAINES